MVTDLPRSLHGVHWNHARCPYCGEHRRADWPECWFCDPKERADFQRVLEDITDRQQFDVLEPPGGYRDYDDMPGRTHDGGYVARDGD